jgi:hypothetical protein
MNIPLGGTTPEWTAYWLGEFLLDKGGQAPAGDVKRAARAVGITLARLAKAKDLAGVVSTGPPERPVWALGGPALPAVPQVGHQPTEAAGQGQATTARPSMRVPTGVDQHGYPTDYVDVDNAEAHSHWSSGGWHRI